MKVFTTKIDSHTVAAVVDCGFLRLPTHPDFHTIFLEQDNSLSRKNFILAA